MNRSFCVAAALSVASIAVAASLFAHAPATGNFATRLSHDVAPVSPNKSSTGNTCYQRTPGGLTYANYELVGLIQGAYAMQDFQLTAGPAL
jgi:hypothetical protein